MEVLAGVIIGLLIALALGKKPIDIHINTTHDIKRTNEEVRPILPEMELLSDAMHNSDPKEDEVYMKNNSYYCKGRAKFIKDQKSLCRYCICKNPPFAFMF